MIDKLLGIAFALVFVGHFVFGSVAFAQSFKVEQVGDYSNGKIMAFDKLVIMSDTIFRVSYVVLTPTQKIEIALPQGGASSAGASLGLIFRTEQPLAALNGGFLRTYAPATPSGLLQVRGEELNPLAPLSDKEPVMSGVICFGQRRPVEIVPLA